MRQRAHAHTDDTYTMSVTRTTRWSCPWLLWLNIPLPPNTKLEKCIVFQPVVCHLKDVFFIQKSDMCSYMNTVSGKHTHSIHYKHHYCMSVYQIHIHYLQSYSFKRTNPMFSSPVHQLNLMLKSHSKHFLLVLYKKCINIWKQCLVFIVKALWKGLTIS